MPGNYTITTRASGTILTAAIYNADHQNHVDNNTPQGVDDYSANQAQMQTQTDPGSVGTESLATSTAQEFERIRFALARLAGTTYWYQQPNANADAMKNRIINGDMKIDQRNVGNTLTPTTSAFIVDRWQLGVTQASKITGQRVTSAPANFVNSLKLLVASAFSSGAGDAFFLQQNIEGVNLADLGWGTANAKTVTLSFWVFCSLTGTFVAAIRNGANDRAYLAPYTILVANTWTYITLTIPGDITGTWATGTTSGMAVAFDLGSGTSFNGVASNWQAGNLLRVAGSVNWVAGAGATFFITGVQLEVNSFASNFAVRPFGQELMLCQRYFQKTFAQTVAPVQNAGLNSGEVTATAVFAGAALGNFVLRYPVVMRGAIPTLVTYNPGAANANIRDISASLDCTGPTNLLIDSGGRIQFTTNGGSSVGNLLGVHYTLETEL